MVVVQLVVQLEVQLVVQLVVQVVVQLVVQLVVQVAQLVLQLVVQLVVQVVVFGASLVSASLVNSSYRPSFSLMPASPPELRGIRERAVTNEIGTPSQTRAPDNQFRKM